MFIFVKNCVNEGKIARFVKHEGLNAEPARGDARNQPGRNLPHSQRSQQAELRFASEDSQRFPQLNPDWLLLDSTQMYRDEYTDVPKPSAPTVAPQLPIDDGLYGLFGSPEIEAAAPKAARQEPEDFESFAQSTAAQFPVSRTGANVQRVVLFYDDQTFESFSPTKR